MRRLLFALPILLVLPSAPARADGVNLAWTDCAGSPRGAANMTFNCADDATTFNVVGSFVPPGGISALSAEVASVLVITDKPALPDWWQFDDGGCRSGVLGAQFTFQGLSGCTNYWGTQTMGAYVYSSTYAHGQGQIRMVAAKPSTALGMVTPGREYYAFQLTLTADGTSRCGGCNEGICVLFEKLELDQPPGYGGDFIITSAARSNFVSWQGGAASCAAAGGRGTVRKTWGHVKGMYR
jgi:hypothetical protein